MIMQDMQAINDGVRLIVHPNDLGIAGNPDQGFQQNPEQRSCIPWIDS